MRGPLGLSLSGRLDGAWLALLQRAHETAGHVATAFVGTQRLWQPGCRSITYRTQRCEQTHAFAAQRHQQLVDLP